MILDANGSPTSSIASAFGTRAPEVTPEVAPQPKNRDYRPAPGKVTLLRQAVETHFVKDAELDIVKPDPESETLFQIFAKVVRVGEQAPNGMAPFFTEGQIVTVEPSMLREVPLGPNLTVWIAPFMAVTGVFADDNE